MPSWAPGSTQHAGECKQAYNYNYVPLLVITSQDTDSVYCNKANFANKI